MKFNIHKYADERTFFSHERNSHAINHDLTLLRPHYQIYNIFDIKTGRFKCDPQKTVLFNSWR